MTEKISEDQTGAFYGTVGTIYLSFSKEFLII